MDRPDTNLTAATVGRGLEAFEFPVDLEPAWLPQANTLPAENLDDGKHPGLISRLFSRRTPNETNLATLPNSQLPPTAALSPITELPVRLPQTGNVTSELSERLLLNLATPSSTAAFEMIGTQGEVQIQFAVRSPDAERCKALLKSYIDGAEVSIVHDHLSGLIRSSDPLNKCPLLVEFGLRRPVLYPLNAFRSFEPDPILGLVNCLSHIRQDELCVFQVLFRTTKRDWHEILIKEMRSRTRSSNFQGYSTSVSTFKEKFSKPILAASVRLLVIAPERERSLEISKGFLGTAQMLSRPDGNELVALRELSLPMQDQLEAAIKRVGYRTGMLLNAAELAGIAHLPTDSVICPKLNRNDRQAKRAPGSSNEDAIIQLGINPYDGNSDPVGLSCGQLTRHMFVCGGSGGGKSTFICQSIRQLSEKGFGALVVDPAGDLTDEIISVIPENRLPDTIIFDASDAEYPLGFNPLVASSDAEKRILSSDLVGLFKHYTSSWGALMEAAVAQAVNAFLYNSKPGTLQDLKKFLIEKDFRKSVLNTVENESVRYFWENESSGINAKSLASVLIRLDGFLRHPLIRNIVGQRQMKLNFREIMDTGKMLLVKVSQGQVGQENAALLGSLIVSKIYQNALMRQETKIEDRRPFWVFADEVQNYLTPSLGMILAGTRKYSVGLTLATQSFRLIQNRDPELAESILANCLTRICFRLGDEDAKRFAQGFSTFSSEDLQRLDVGEAIARIERADHDFNLKTFPPLAVASDDRRLRMERVLVHTRWNFGTPRSEVEADFRHQYEANASVPKLNSLRHDCTAPSPDAKKKSGIASEQQIQQHANPGRHHQDIQAVVKRIAESYGFAAQIEAPVMNSKGRVDVSLQNDSIRIACEVSVSTTTYEVTNIHKCLSAGYDFVVVIVSNQTKTDLIKSKIHSHLGSLPDNRVKVLALPDFLAFLRKFNAANQHPNRSGSVPKGRLSFAEACEVLNIGQSTLYRWIREGRVPFYRPGREYSFDRDELLLMGKSDLSGKRKAVVKLQPLAIERSKSSPKKQQDTKYRKLLKLD